MSKNKDKIFDKFNSDIESGNVLNWAQLKKLKNHRANVSQFDSPDMENFEKFLKKLYSNVLGTISLEKKVELWLTKENEHLTNIDCTDPAQITLNRSIKLHEVTESISTLKKAKALLMT